MRSVVVGSSLLVMLFFMTSCGHMTRSKNIDADDTPAVAVEEENAPEEVEISAADEISSEEYGEVKLIVNRPVMNWISYFQGRGRKHMTRYLERTSRYFPMMKRVLREEGLPEDLVYVPLIESGLSSSAHSFASAVGYWQFIRSTGKRYGLKISPYIDERRDPVLSTKAAAKYFKALYNLFGDWYLALASYNTGENRVKRAVMRSGTRNFWKLAKQRKLHKETRNYVPKYLAALIIAKDPRKYGFTDIQYEPELSFDKLAIFKPISLAKLAKNMNIEYEALKRINPRYRSDFVPVDSGESVNIRVPKGLGSLALAQIENSHSAAPKIIPNDVYWYRVRRGDTLSGIAVRNRTNVSTIRRMNHLRRRSFIRVGQRLKVPDRGTNKLRRAQRSKASRVTSTASGDYHTVRRGENLSVIARRYGISIFKIKELNRLGRKSLIRVGQKLKVRDSAPGEVRRPSSKMRQKSFHVVRRGENLTLIAKRYNVSLAQLRTWNGLDSKSIIKVREKLRVRPVATSRRKLHIVKPGENLSIIAEKYKVSVALIAKENSIRSRSKIFVGRKLTIPNK